VGSHHRDSWQASVPASPAMVHHGVDSGVLGAMTWVQLISFCFGSLPVFKFRCGCLQAGGLAKAEGAITVQGSSVCFAWSLTGGTGVAVGTLLCRASVTSVLLPPFCR